MTMKTTLFFLGMFGIVIGAASIGAQSLDFGTVFSALAAGVMFAMALNDTPRTLRPLRRPAAVRFSARRNRTFDLAA